MTFKQFLRKNYLDSDTPHGDFANDFLNDKRLIYKEFEFFYALKDYLVSVYACEEAIFAAKDCWFEWMKNKKE